MNLRSNKILTIICVLACISVFASGGIYALVNKERTQRQEDNIANDLFACERGNVLRDDIRALARASLQLDREVLDIIFARVDNQEVIREILEDLEPAFERYNEAVTAIKNVNCEEVIRGG